MSLSRNGMMVSSYTSFAGYASGNLTLRPFSIVNQIIYDKKKGKATGTIWLNLRRNALLNAVTPTVGFMDAKKYCGLILPQTCGQQIPLNHLPFIIWLLTDDCSSVYTEVCPCSTFREPSAGPC